MAMDTYAINEDDLRKGIPAASLLLRLRLIASLAEAQALIAQGQVFANDLPVTSAEMLLPATPSTTLVLRAGPAQVRVIPARWE